MMQSLLHLQICATPPAAYGVPLLLALKKQLPSLTTFDFDNFSEESIRQYAATLVGQSQQVAVVVEVKAPEASIAGLSTFFNRVLHAKPERLVLVLQGQQPLLQKMMQTIAPQHFHQQLTEEALQQLLLKFFSPA